MIKQITVRNSLMLQNKRDEYSNIATATHGYHFLSKREEKDLDDELRPIRQGIEADEKELNVLINSGFRVIAATPIRQGEGVNLILYKADE
jgi:hypothetical protein